VDLHREATLRERVRDERGVDGRDRVEFALVEPNDDDVVLGGGSLNSINFEQGRAGVGYWLAPSARGRGVATHAVRLIARWAFSDLHLARPELTCGPDNRASQRVGER
jgi:[ribosomal protein S5]-alanine N-acetyltransferase